MLAIEGYLDCSRYAEELYCHIMIGSCQIKLRDRKVFGKVWCERTAVPLRLDDGSPQGRLSLYPRMREM